MIICYWGDDHEGSRQAAREAWRAHREKFAGAPVFEFAGESITSYTLAEIVSARPLFGDRTLVLYDH